jgi:hypothetical protein
MKNEQLPALPKTQVVSLRLSVYDYNLFQKKCLLENRTMTSITRQAILEFIKPGRDAKA